MVALVAVWSGVALAGTVGGTVAWSTAQGADYPRLVATVDGKQIQTDEKPMLNIEKTGDFNNDGVMDALISWSSSGGGNCCPPDWVVATVRDGRIVEAAIPVYSWEAPSLLPDSTGVRFSFTEEDKYSVVRFDGREVKVVQTLPRASLTAVAEVKGTAPFTPGPPRTLSADINGDGKPDTITCEVWERWGSLLCTVPTPAGPQRLSTGCDRFGVLTTKTNGYSDLVCNHDLVLKYDGKAYSEPK